MTDTENKISEALLTENLKDCLMRAEDGDVIEGKKALDTIIMLLSPHNVNPQTGKHNPLPTCVLDYLSKAFIKIANKKNASQALNLTRAGRPQKISPFEKRLAADLVYQLIKSGVSLCKARTAVTDVINNKILPNLIEYPAWRGLKNKEINEDELLDWFYDLQPELDEIYNNVDL